MRPPSSAGCSRRARTAPTQRDVLEYNVVGGQVICDSVALNNPSKHAVTVRLYAADALQHRRRRRLRVHGVQGQAHGCRHLDQASGHEGHRPCREGGEHPHRGAGADERDPRRRGGRRRRPGHQGASGRERRRRERRRARGSGCAPLRPGGWSASSRAVVDQAQPPAAGRPPLLARRSRLGDRELPGRQRGERPALPEVERHGQDPHQDDSPWPSTSSPTCCPAARRSWSRRRSTGLRWGSLTGRVRAKVTVTAEGAQPVTREVTVWRVPWLSLLGAGSLLAADRRLLVHPPSASEQGAGRTAAAEAAVAGALTPVVDH